MRLPVPPVAVTSIDPLASPAQLMMLVTETLVISMVGEQDRNIKVSKEPQTFSSAG